MAIIHDSDHKEEEREAQSLPANCGLAEILDLIDRKSSSGDKTGALALCQEALWLMPERADLLSRATALSAATGDWRAALMTAQRWVRAMPESAEAYLTLGDIQAALGNSAARESAWRRYRALDPADSAGTASRHSLEPERLTPAYVAALFDGYAKNFDVALARLEYRGPEILRDSLRPFLPQTIRPGFDVLDLGCGTGLAGVAFKPYAKKLHGIDLSREMLAIAASRKIYDDLIHTEAQAFLSQPGPRYNIMLAADMLVYISDLAPLFAAAAGRLFPRGLFAATTEALAEDGGPPQDIAAGFRLQPTRRYAHSESHIRSIAARCELNVLAFSSCVTRTEKHVPVPGFAFVLENKA